MNYALNELPKQRTLSLQTSLLFKFNFFRPFQFMKFKNQEFALQTLFVKQALRTTVRSTYSRTAYWEAGRTELLSPALQTISSESVPSNRTTLFSTLFSFTKDSIARVYCTTHEVAHRQLSWWCQCTTFSSNNWK